MPLKWTRTGRSWWRLGFAEIPQRYLDAIKDIPGVTITGQPPVRGVAHGVSVTAHRTAFFAPAFEAFFNDLDCAPENLRDDPYLSTLWAPKFDLRAYQEEGIAWLADGGGGLLCDEMGLGKTIQAISACESLLGRDPDVRALIIGPKFTRAVWRNELIATGAIKDESQFFAAMGQPDQELEERMRECRYWFMHYDVLENWKHIIQRPLRCERPKVCIIDEAHWMRNPKSKRGNVARVIGTSIKHRIVLTGTPIENSIDDLWALLTVVNGEGSWGSLFTFKKRYTHMRQGDYGWVSEGVRNQEELHARLASCYLRRTCAVPEIAAQIPTLSRILHRVDGTGTAIDPELRKYIGKDRTAALRNLREHLARSSFGAETLKVLSAWRKWTSRVKLPHTSEYVATLALEGEHVVVFCWERATAERLVELVEKAARGIDKAHRVRVFAIHGGLEQSARDDLIAQFQASTAPQVLIATIDSLSAGVTLNRARHVVQHDTDYMLSKLLQADKRIHRVSSTLPCYATYVIVEDSADELIVEHLRRKAQDTAAALRDETGNEVLDELGLNVRDMGSEDAAALLRSLLAM